MTRRFVSIWFPHLKTDWFSLSQPHLRKVPFVLRELSHGRMIITAANEIAQSKGIDVGMVLADARAFIPDLEVRDDEPGLPQKLLNKLADWCIRFSPVVGLDLPDGLLLDVTGCTHLWGDDENYLNTILRRLTLRNYDTKAGMADTIGVAWAIARFAKDQCVIKSGEHIEALLSLPPEALRLESETTERLHKLGLHRISQFINIPRQSLRRRFGTHIIKRIDEAFGNDIEEVTPVYPLQPYEERLPCMEPIVTAAGIEVALQELLKTLCFRLQKEQKGLRIAVLKGYRVDGKIVEIRIETNRPTHHVNHLFKLFEIKLSSIEPALGIELFTMEALKVEEYFSEQGKMWQGTGGLADVRLSELLDRLASRVGMGSINRYLPAEHYWPERSYYKAGSLEEESMTSWRRDKLRPLCLLVNPERIEVTAPIPDYPPMLFRYNGRVHNIVRADGPERIEQEWWLQQGQHKDYYYVEDEASHRYWIFRLGHYDDKDYQWYLHGYFA